MHALDPITLRECLGLAKLKLDLKAQATCAAHCPRGFSASGVNTLIIGTDLGVLFTINAVTGVMRIVCNLGDLIPIGGYPRRLVWGKRDVNRFGCCLIIACKRGGQSRQQRGFCLCVTAAVSGLLIRKSLA